MIYLKICKKIISVILILTLCAGLFSAAAFAESDKLNYLVLGDSIAEGFGLKNPEEACYGRIVADTNGYDYVNAGVMGRNSDRLYKFLTISKKLLATTRVPPVCYQLTLAWS